VVLARPQPQQVMAMPIPRGLVRGH
jgi:hypothetical protein